MDKQIRRRMDLMLTEDQRQLIEELAKKRKSSLTSVIVNAVKLLAKQEGLAQ